MKQDKLKERAEEIGRKIITKWCENTFEGEMLTILKNSCAVHAVRELTQDMEDIVKDVPVIEMAAKSVVEETLKEYINKTF